jgi:thiol-disulfide isomerase/thioredoxin
MKKFCLLFCLLILIINLSAQQIKKLKVDELKTYIEQSDHPLIVNFWATFCAPCISEIPYLQSEAEKYKSEGVELLLVSLDSQDYYPSKIFAFAKRKNFTAHIVWLNETTFWNFYARIDKKWSGGIPSSLFINNKTHYRKFFDRQLTEPQVEETIKAFLKE